MAEFKIAVIDGDGIGIEIMAQALRVLEKIRGKFGYKFILRDCLMGGAAIDKTGVPLPDESVKICRESHAVLLGAVGGEKWNSLPVDIRPEAGLLKIRRELGLYANLRPAKASKRLVHASALKPEIIANTDIMIVRELCGGIYFGARERGSDYALDTEKYSDFEVDRIARTAFEIARKRRKRLCSVDKANVLESSRFWRERVINISGNYKDVELAHMYVDNAAMQLVRNPRQFDVLLTTNMFGDILSDETAEITGSIGMSPSASLRGDSFGLYEPAHGSAPDIAGKNIANPCAMILSAAMMLRYTFDLEHGASLIESAVDKALEQGYRTADIALPGEKTVGTAEMGAAVIQNI